MKGIHALLVGVIGGLVLGTVVFGLGATPLQVCFISSLVLFLFSTTSLIIFSLVGWPDSLLSFDYYDLHRIVIGVTATTALMGMMVKGAEKLSVTLSVSMASGLLISALGTILYVVASIVALHSVRKSFTPQRIRSDNWGRSYFHS